MLKFNKNIGEDESSRFNTDSGKLLANENSKLEVKKDKEVAKNSGSVFVKYMSCKEEKKEAQGISIRYFNN